MIHTLELFHMVALTATGVSFLVFSITVYDNMRAFLQYANQHASWPPQEASPMMQNNPPPICGASVRLVYIKVIAVFHQSVVVAVLSAFFR